MSKQASSFTIRSLIDDPKQKEALAQWFFEKWGVPKEEYEKSMDQCLEKKNAVPQWYAGYEGDRIVCGAGVIENDFHERKDLTPNVCAVYTEEDRRCRGYAGKLLGYICADMKKRGIAKLYLLTDHKDFYERYGWSFHCMVLGDGEEEPSRMYIHKEP